MEDKRLFKQSILPLNFSMYTVIVITDAEELKMYDDCWCGTHGLYETLLEVYLWIGKNHVMIMPISCIDTWLFLKRGQCLQYVKLDVDRTMGDQFFDLLMKKEKEWLWIEVCVVFPAIDLPHDTLQGRSGDDRNYQFLLFYVWESIISCRNRNIEGITGCATIKNQIQRKNRTKECISKHIYA